MKVVLTSLSNQLFQESRVRLNDSAKKYGITEIYSYDFDDLKGTVFFEKNKEILEQFKGLGYWLWKPYIILETIKKIDYGDIVIYSDSGIEIIHSLDPLIAICKEKEDILLFGNSNFSNRQWTKRDCFVLMNCDTDNYWDALHCDAAFSLFRKTEFSIKFLNEWLKYGCNKYIITDLPNTCGKENLSGYIEHRRDQSILSLLANKYNIPLYRMPTQYGNHYKMEEYRIENEFNCVSQSDQILVHFYALNPYFNSPYSQLLNHHRTKEKSGQVKEAISNFKDRMKRLNKIIHRIERKLFSVPLIPKFNKSYSQCGEDLLVQYVFRLRGINKPSFIDIGANDPYFLNNTAIFYDKGCRGLNIEANPYLINRFKESRQEDINLNIGIGDTEGIFNFYIMNDPTLSTFSKDECEKYIKTGKYLLQEITEIHITTIKKILDDYFNGQFPDFLSLDAEGMDFEILKSIDFEVTAPKVICVEAAEYSSIGAGVRRQELIEFLVLKGYYEYANTNLNAIMVKNDFWFV